MSRTGINVIRRTSSGPNSRSIINHIARDAMRQGSPPTLQRAVVVDIICDPSLLTEEYLTFVANNVDNAELTDVMPINSIIARIVSNQGGMAAAIYTILFPFWSSHIEMPVKPGEQVYVIYEDYENTGYKVGYWLTRGAAQQTIEDSNYTHLDRRFDGSMNIDNLTTQQRVSLRNNPLPPVGFNNGGNTVNTLTLVPSGSRSENPYDTILRNAVSNRYITYEPVPRWRKRPQELVLQGSNNSLIMLGEDRNGPVSGAIQQSTIDVKGQAGAIDLVVGRGRFLSNPGTDPRQDGSNPAGPESTAPLTTTNSRGQIETDKAPYRTGKLVNPLEGDPSPIHDAARIYIVQQSKVDENYKLAHGTGISYPENTLQVVQTGGNNSTGRSYVVAKADHIRIIGRKNQTSGINGTVLLIREGQTDVDLGYILINEEGKIQVEAPKIYLGKATQEGEPYIKYSEYKKAIDALQGEIDAVNTRITNMINQINIAFTGATAIPFSAVATLTAAVAPITTEISSLNREIASGKVDTQTARDNSPSTKVFGE